MTYWFQNIPDELKLRPQWVIWRFRTQKGKLRKVPFIPHRPFNEASHSDPSTWGTYQEAEKRCMELTDVDGIGYVLSDTDPYIAIDLDEGCSREAALDFIQGLRGYVELSPSRSGIHIWIRGKEKLPAGRRKVEPYEIYEKWRYLTFTGWSLNVDTLELEQGGPSITEIPEVNPEVLLGLYHRYFEPVKQVAPPTNKQLALQQVHDLLHGPPQVQHRPAAPSAPPKARREVDAQDPLDLVQGKPYAEKFWQLWHGNTSRFYSSKTKRDDLSAADLALCNYLADLCKESPSEMDRWFRQSALYRPEKWDRKNTEGVTYGERTIQKALDR